MLCAATVDCHSTEGPVSSLAFGSPVMFDTAYIVFNSTQFEYSQFM